MSPTHKWAHFRKMTRNIRAMLTARHPVLLSQAPATRPPAPCSPALNASTCTIVLTQQTTLILALFGQINMNVYFGLSGSSLSWEVPGRFCNSFVWNAKIQPTRTFSSQAYVRLSFSYIRIVKNAQNSAQNVGFQSIRGISSVKAICF